VERVEPIKPTTAKAYCWVYWSNVNSHMSCKIHKSPNSLHTKWVMKYLEIMKDFVGK